MNRIFEAASELQSFCGRLDWNFCFIGGLAVQRWGEPRNTQDADFTLITGFGNEQPFIEQLLAHFRPRRDDAQAFALQNRVLLLYAGNGVPLDIALGAMPFEENSVKRSSLWSEIDGDPIRTCSAEDLIVHKVFAGRDRDWLDVDGVLIRQASSLNLTIIKEELPPLLDLKEDSLAWPRLQSLCQRHDLLLS